MPVGVRRQRTEAQCAVGRALVTVSPALGRRAEWPFALAAPPVVAGSRPHARACSAVCTARSGTARSHGAGPPPPESHTDGSFQRCGPRDGQSAVPRTKSCVQKTPVRPGHVPLAHGPPDPCPASRTCIRGCHRVPPAPGRRVKRNRKEEEERKRANTGGKSSRSVPLKIIGRVVATRHTCCPSRGPETRKQAAGEN